MRLSLVFRRWQARREARRYYEWGRAVEIAAGSAAAGQRAGRLFRRGLRAMGTVADQPGSALSARQDLERVLSAAAPWHRVNAWSRRRCLMVAALAVVLTAAGIAGVVRGLVASHNVALDRPWQASSGDSGFPAAGNMTDTPASVVFMHTAEEDKPWVKLDLPGLRPLRQIEIVNRSDCCADRAVPLVIEFSVNGETWEAVARRAAPFSVWRASIRPRMARFVRVRLDRRGILHLRTIRVFE